MKAKVQTFLQSKVFNHFIVLLVLLDVVLMGVEELYTSETLVRVQHIITYIYIFELALRWFGRENTASYRKDRRNFFDFLIIPFALFPSTGAMVLLKLYRSTLVLNQYNKVMVHLHSVINTFYLKNIKKLSY